MSLLTYPPTHASPPSTEHLIEACLATLAPDLSAAATGEILWLSSVPAHDVFGALGTQPQAQGEA